MWSLKIIDDIGFPSELCDLNNITIHKYPIVRNKDPNEFINGITQSRTKS